MMKKAVNILFYIIAIFYIFIMIDLLFRFSYIFDTDRIILRSYNLIPFKTILEYATPIGSMNMSTLSFANVNLFGNIVVFIPYGIYLGVIKKHKEFAKSLMILAVTSIIIEVTQFTFGLGAGDIDDVILNISGGVIGIIGYRFLRKIMKDEFRTKTVITVIAIIFGVPTIYFYFTTIFNHLKL